MDKRKIGYWIATGLFGFVFLAGGIANLMRAEPQVEAIEALGYPPYLLTILGIAKVLGSITVLVPGLPRLKEWAYAGFAFDMIGAAMSHALAGDPLSALVSPIVISAVGAVSYLLRPASRRL